MIPVVGNLITVGIQRAASCIHCNPARCIRTLVGRVKDSVAVLISHFCEKYAFHKICHGDIGSQSLLIRCKTTARPGEVAPSTIYLFRREPPSEENPDGPNLRIKVLLNLDSGSRRRVTIRPWQYGAMLSTLRLLARRPDTYQFSVVAYSFEDQSVLYRQALSNQINFQALGRAIKKLSPGTVEYADLGKGKETNFFGQLLYDELTNDGTLDALVFLGHDPFTGKRVAQEFVRSLNKGGYPVFYLNSSRHPWRGIVGQAVRTLGGKAYSVRRPSELSSALDKMLAKIVEQRTPPDD